MSTSTPLSAARKDPLGRPYVVDEHTGTVGVLMGETYGDRYMRPVHGGPEWVVSMDRLRPATAAEIGAAR